MTGVCTWGRRRSWRRLIVLVGLGLVTALPPSAGAQGATTILVLHTYGPDAPARLAFDTVLQGVLREQGVGKVELFEETLDPNRFVGETQSSLMRTHLRNRYAGKRIDVIATVYDRAFTFVTDRRDPLFPDVPVAALLSRYPQVPSDRAAFAWSGPSFGETASLALRLQPRTRSIAIVDGVPPAEASSVLYAEARRQIAASVPHVNLIALQGLPLDVVIDRVGALPSDAIVVFVRQVIGRGGGTIASYDAVRALAAASPVAVYANADVQIGNGAIGGVVVSVDQEARNLASLALAVAQRGVGRTDPIKNVPTPVVDWRQLRRWGISEDRLPAGTVVRFRQLGVWEQYKYYIVTAATVVLVQSGLIAGLYVQGRRRRRLALALIESEGRARLVAEQNRDLAGRLLHAQEAERTRIARNLHDDVSQEVAGMSILLSSLTRSLRHEGPTAPIGATIAELQRFAGRLGAAVRHLSHQLHPGVLKHAGLVAALTQHCAEVEGHHGLTIVLSAEGDFDAVEFDEALCLYRVAQEALTNVVRHAGARSACVNLRRTATGVQLRISDDGVGFDAAARARAGVGLRSIDERVRLAGGTVSVESAPGHGSSIAVELPESRVLQHTP